MKTPSLIYLDNSTTARPSEKAISAMMPYWTTYWGIPSTPHQKGQELYPHLADLYQTLYRVIGAKESDNVIMTSSGSEAVNHVISSVYRDLTLSTGKNQFITSRLDEAASMMAISHLEPFGCSAKIVDSCENGKISASALADCLSPRTALVSLSWANGLTGVIQPLSEIAALCKQRGIRLHVDATHVIGKLFFDLEELGIDYLTINGEPLHAPKGTGVLYVRQGISCSPFIFGSADQGGMRAGGVNMPGLAGLACALNESLECRDLLCTEIARLRTQLEQGVMKQIPSARICFREEERLPHCTTIIFPGVANEALLYLLNRKGVCATVGGGNFQQLGLLLAASGVDENDAHSAISFSLSRYTTEEEIDRAIAIIAESTGILLNLSNHLQAQEK